MEKTIDEVVQEKLQNDTEFQDSLKDLSDEDKAPLIESKRKELVNVEFKSLTEKAKKDEEIAKDQKTRAEKAESDLKKLKPADKKGDESLSTKDFYALTKANVSEEDVDDVAEFAKFKRISVTDALKSPIMKATLADKAEQRKTAQAMNTRSTRTQNSKADGSAIISDIKSKGENSVPEAGSEEAMELFKARHPGFKE